MFEKDAAAPVLIPLAAVRKQAKDPYSWAAWVAEMEIAEEAPVL